MDSNNTAERLRAQVEYPEAWMPEPGQTLIGEALAWETVERDEQPSCEVLTLRDQDGKNWSVWTWHTVLKNELVGKVEPGNFLAIHCRGKRPRQDGGGEYAAYRVAINKTEKPVSDIVVPDEFPEGF
jgi:hypothetical protein